MTRLWGALIAFGMLISGTGEAAANWRAEFKELRFAVTSAENEADTMTRFEAFGAYMQQKLGVPVLVRRGSDYAAVVEALRARQVEFARMGPAAYARAVQLMGESIVPLAKDMDLDGAVGYHSVVAVKAESGFRTINDLKGRSLAFADPNSASGFQAPSYFLNKEGLNPAQYFSRTGFAGNHETGILAVLSGQYDASATWWNNAARSNITRMEEKKMIPAGAMRVIWTSPLIPNSPWVARSLPSDLLEAYTKALLSMPVDAPEVWKRLVDGKMLKPVAASREEYLDMVRMIEENQRSRRGS